MNDFLGKIVDVKREEVRAARAAAPLPALRSRCRDLPPPRPFAAALRREGLSVIAEAKRASPSAGIIRDPFDPAGIARACERGGAAALSVLTEGSCFLGSLDHLRRAREAVRLPVLRKDFIVDEYQVYESAAAGADAILLIAELLDFRRLRDYLALAKNLGLACLVETHGKKELEKALEAGAEIVGVNNRDLKTLRVDLGVSLELLPLIPDGRVKVSESGIRSAEDAARLRAAGADALLVGEAILRSGDIADTIRILSATTQTKSNERDQAPILPRRNTSPCRQGPQPDAARRYMKIKICGLTRPKDVLSLNGLPVDYAGFIFVPSSPRCLDLPSAQEIVPLLKPAIKKVGVFMDDDPSRVLMIARALRLDLLQFHGSETPAYCDRFDIPYFKTVRVRGRIDAASLRAYRPEAFLLDTFAPRRHGGTGKTFDWSIARALSDQGLRVLLAGGLNPDNVARAIAEAAPWGVDVSSGVESSPGTKDHSKLQRFISAARGGGTVSTCQLSS